MRVAMPQGASHGWGVAGSYLAAELAKLPAIEGVTLHCITGHDFQPFEPAAWDRINIGYCFFEHQLLAAPFIAEAATRWDHIVAGSSWCEQQLRACGMPRSSTILQGIDAERFSRQPPRQDDGRFIVFSGGKFEFRKGQDIVIAAMKAFMRHHSDVWLSCAWHNHWPASLKTMQQSRLIEFAWRDIPCHELLAETVCKNGLDLDRVLLHPPFANSRMPLVYGESDLGLFPNRCEGGTNLVMSEYMACGRPVIASDRTGQADVIVTDNAWPLSRYQPMEALTNGLPSGVWDEPLVDELVQLLEQAYRDRQALQQKGAAAAAAMQRLNWPDAARRFHQLGCALRNEADQRLVVVSGRCRPPDTTQADQLFVQGLYPEAEERYRVLLRYNPLNPALLNSLGTVLARQGRQTEAVGYYGKALSLCPDLTEARFNLANSLAALDDLHEAVRLLQQVVEREPSWWQAWFSLGHCRRQSGDRQGALNCFEQVVALQPDNAGAWVALGKLFVEKRAFDDALRCYSRAVEREPENMHLLNEKGLLLHELEQLDQAERCFQAVLDQGSCQAAVLNNLGNVHKSALRLGDALCCYDQALQYEPDNPTIQFNRSLALLLQGNCLQAWPGYERRFEMIPPVILPHPAIPRWQGELLSGRRLLVQAEQVYGDTFMFARFLPLAARCGGPVLFQCQDQIIRPALCGLEQVLEGTIVRGEPLPPVDLQIPLLSLPGLMGMTLATIPAPGGYLAATPERVKRWRPALTAPDGQMKVGLVWGGRKAPLNAGRSMQLRDLEPLLSLQGVRFFSLQLGDDAAQLADYEDLVTDLGGMIRDFGDTAAILEQLDLLITIDTAVAHLAGALGRPAWVLLKYSPDWRWLLNRHDSPWYESVQLFRQPFCNSGWQPVLQEVREKLCALLAKYKKTAKVSAGG